MSEGEALIALIPWIEDQERVTLYKSEGCWYIEWFNLKGGFNYSSGETLQIAAEGVK